VIFFLMTTVLIYCLFLMILSHSLWYFYNSFLIIVRAGIYMHWKEGKYAHILCADFFKICQKYAVKAKNMQKYAETIWVSFDRENGAWSNGRVICDFVKICQKYAVKAKKYAKICWNNMGIVWSGSFSWQVFSFLASKLKNKNKKKFFGGGEFLKFFLNFLEKWRNLGKNWKICSNMSENSKICANHENMQNMRYQIGLIRLEIFRFVKIFCQHWSLTTTEKYAFS